MTSTEHFLTLGSPKFEEPRLARLSASHGVTGAWREACKNEIAQALAGITGDFAMGLKESNERTFLAVDRLAIRSLCYRVVNGELRFAARADELADATTEIDPQAIFDYLFFHTIPSPRTIFKGIFRLPPAHYVVWEGGKLSIAPYWEPQFLEARSPSFRDLKDEFKGLLREAVATQLDAGKPACFLSGGTDSSTVAGLIGEVSGQAAATYSIGFDASGYDEMAFARIAARQFNTKHHEYYLTPADLVHSIPLVASHYDQPFGNSSSLPAYYCAAMAQSDGVVKILTGDGGDELFGGNTRYAKQRVFNWYHTLPHPLRAHVLEPVFGLPSLGKLPVTRKAASYVAQARVPMPDRLNLYNVLIRLGVPNILTPDFLAMVNPDHPAVQQRQVWGENSAQSTLNRNLAFDWRYTLAENDLPKVCGTAQLAGVQVGFPLLDQRLIDFSLKLPQEYKVKGFQLRWFFKEALRGFLPDEIIQKQKHGFGLPFGVWATRDGALKRLARESLHDLGERGLVRRDFMETLLTQRLPEHPGYYGEMVWILVMLEQWLQQHAPSYRLT